MRPVLCLSIAALGALLVVATPASAQYHPRRHHHHVPPPHWHVPRYVVPPSVYYAPPPRPCWMVTVPGWFPTPGGGLVWGNPGDRHCW